MSAELAFPLSMNSPLLDPRCSQCPAPKYHRLAATLAIVLRLIRSGHGIDIKRRTSHMKMFEPARVAPFSSLLVIVCCPHQPPRGPALAGTPFPFSHPHFALHLRVVLAGRVSRRSPRVRWWPENRAFFWSANYHSGGVAGLRRSHAVEVSPRLKDHCGTRACDAFRQVRSFPRAVLRGGLDGHLSCHFGRALPKRTASRPTRGR